MIRLMTVLAASTILAGCASNAVEVAPPPPVEAAEAAPAPVPEVPKPTYGTFGIETAGMDTSIAPGDDFFGYMSGTWDKTTEIPADKSRYGMFNVLDDLSKQRTRTIIEEQAKNPASKIGAAYNSFMNQVAIEAKGLSPLEPWLNEIRALDSKSGLDELYAKGDEIGISGPFRMFVGQDDKAPEHYILNLRQGGIGMPDRDYYLSDDPKLAETRAKYLTHLTNVLTLAGESNAAARAKAILDFETKLAKAHWTRAESRDAEKTYNKYTVAELEKAAPGFDFSGFFNGVAPNIGEVLVAQPSAFTGEAAAIAKAPLSVLKDQLLVRSIDSYASYLPKAIDDERFSFYGTVLSGVPQQEPRWRRGVNFTVGVLGDDVSQLYVQRYFPPETKAAADKLVQNIIGAMGRRIDALEWMTPATKAKAHQKLAAFTPKIGYPSQWRDMSGLAIQADDLLGNAMRANRFTNAYELGKLGGPIRRWEWGMTPMTINAYANSGLVEIVFPAAILQPPFFDPNADDAVNYGGIGAVIGHELSHHFDDQGAKYDSTGKLIDWWTPGDTKAFTARLDKYEKQINSYEPLPGLHVNGKLTMGENVADLAGLTVAHDAYVASLNGQEAPVIDGTTGDQRFYMGWAQVWRCKSREAALRQQLLTDPHSPCPVRTDVVRNLDPWYSAFDVQPGQALYLAPEDRVRIW
ncbi:MAG TPA: M13-type metalloendopeptidase [Sphingomicrobium sp.]|nr:M13-type metalloendopeptidase [Sphingomicrobium sp.]